jgi:uncharacterized protein YceK
MSMTRFSPLVLLIGLCLLSGCAAVRSRTVGYRVGGVGGPPVFSGVSLDCIQIFDRDSITDPGMKWNPVLAGFDAPFSLVGDIIFLPYDGVVYAVSQ